jgi:ketosteroid isomerase-like protein
MADDDGAAQIAAAFDLFNDYFRSGELDRDELARLFEPDVHHVSRFAALEGRAYEGYDGLAQFLAEMREQFEQFDISLERVVGEGDERVAIYTVDALTHDTRIPIEQRLGMEIRLRGGRLQRTNVHADPRQALAAAGLDTDLA